MKRRHFNDETDKRRFERVVRAVSRASYAEAGDILGRCRKPTFVRPRYMVQYILYWHYGWNYSEIARAMLLDHSTVMHGVRVVQGSLENGTDYSYCVREAETILYKNPFHECKTT